MSNDNENKNKSRNMTHVQFFKACAAFKRNKDVFQAKRPGRWEAAQMLSEMVGFKISGASIRDIMEATGITWNSRKDTTKKPGSQQSIRQNAITTLTRALAQIYERLGEDKPKGFQALVDLIRQQDLRPTTSEQNLPAATDDDLFDNPISPGGGN